MFRLVCCVALATVVICQRAPGAISPAGRPPMSPGSRPPMSPGVRPPGSLAPASPPGTADTCKPALTKICPDMSGQGLTCFQCAIKNQEELEEARCTRQMIASYCLPQPAPGASPANPPPLSPNNCGPTLGKLCGTKKGQGDSCLACVDDNKAALEAAGCTNAQFNGFCTGAPAAGNNCSAELLDVCPDLQNQGPTCLQCTTKNALSLQAAGCTLTDYENYCSAPTPPPGSATCEDELKSACGQFENQGMPCFNCTARNYADLVKAGCRGTDLRGFCMRPPGPPPPGAPAPPGNTCRTTLLADCPNLYGKGDECFDCTKKYETALEDAGCSNDALERYCNGGSSGGNCTATMNKVCGDERRQGDSCMSCIKENYDAVEAAGCQMTNFQRFCYGAAPGAAPGRAPGSSPGRAPGRAPGAAPGFSPGRAPGAPGRQEEE